MQQHFDQMIKQMCWFVMIVQHLHGSNISVFESNGSYNANGVTDAMLNNLQIGDLLYIAGLAYDNGTQAINPNVTHVIMWTGQKISTSSFI